MKRIIATLAVATIGIGAAAVALTDFRDVPTDHPRRTDIFYAVAQEWFEGYPDGTFRPDQVVPPHQVATVVRRALGDSPTRGDLATFMRAGAAAIGVSRGDTRERAIGVGGTAWINDWTIEQIGQAQYDVERSGVRVDVRLSNWGDETRSPSSWYGGISFDVYGDQTGTVHDGGSRCGYGSALSENKRNDLDEKLEPGRQLDYTVCFTVNERDSAPSFMKVEKSSRGNDDERAWIRLRW